MTSATLYSASGQRQLVDNTQHKLLLLFVFDKMEIPLSENTVLDFCTYTNVWLNYVDCKTAFHDLLSADLICSYNTHSKDNPLYVLTSDGRTCLAHFFQKVPSSLREEISQKAKQQRLRFKRKQEYVSDYQRNTDGTYKVILKIMELGRPVVEIAMNVPDRSTAKSMFEKWEIKAPATFQSLMEIFEETEK